MNSYYTGPSHNHDAHHNGENNHHPQQPQQQQNIAGSSTDNFTSSGLHDFNMHHGSMYTTSLGAETLTSTSTSQNNPNKNQDYFSLLPNTNPHKTGSDLGVGSALGMDLHHGFNNNQNTTTQHQHQNDLLGMPNTSQTNNNSTYRASSTLSPPSHFTSSPLSNPSSSTSLLQRVDSSHQGSTGGGGSSISRNQQSGLNVEMSRQTTPLLGTPGFAAHPVSLVDDIVSRTSSGAGGGGSDTYGAHQSTSRHRDLLMTDDGFALPQPSHHFSVSAAPINTHGVGPFGTTNDDFSINLPFRGFEANTNYYGTATTTNDGITTTGNTTAGTLTGSSTSNNNNNSSSVDNLFSPMMNPTTNNNTNTNISTITDVAIDQGYTTTGTAVHNTSTSRPDIFRLNSGHGAATSGDVVNNNNNVHNNIDHPNNVEILAPPPSHPPQAPFYGTTTTATTAGTLNSYDYSTNHHYHSGLNIHDATNAYGTTTTTTTTAPTTTNNHHHIVHDDMDIINTRGVKRKRGNDNNIYSTSSTIMDTHTLDYTNQHNNNNYYYQYQQQQQNHHDHDVLAPPPATATPAVVQGDSFDNFTSTFALTAAAAANVPQTGGKNSHNSTTTTTVDPARYYSDAQQYNVQDIYQQHVQATPQTHQLPVVNTTISATTITQPTVYVQPDIVDYTHHQQQYEQQYHHFDHHHDDEEKHHDLFNHDGAEEEEEDDDEPEFFDVDTELRPIIYINTNNAEPYSDAELMQQLNINPLQHVSKRDRNKLSALKYRYKRKFQQREVELRLQMTEELVLIMIGEISRLVNTYDLAQCRITKLTEQLAAATHNTSIPSASTKTVVVKHNKNKNYNHDDEHTMLSALDIFQQFNKYIKAYFLTPRQDITPDDVIMLNKDRFNLNYTFHYTQLMSSIFNQLYKPPFPLLNASSFLPTAAAAAAIVQAQSAQRIGSLGLTAGSSDDEQMLAAKQNVFALKPSRKNKQGTTADTAPSSFMFAMGGANSDGEMDGTNGLMMGDDDTAETTTTTTATTKTGRAARATKTTKAAATKAAKDAAAKEVPAKVEKTEKVEKAEKPAKTNKVTRASTKSGKAAKDAAVAEVTTTTTTTTTLNNNPTIIGTVNDDQVVSLSTGGPIGNTNTATKPVITAQQRNTNSVGTTAPTTAPTTTTVGNSNSMTDAIQVAQPQVTTHPTAVAISPRNNNPYNNNNNNDQQYYASSQYPNQQQEHDNNNTHSQDHHDHDDHHHHNDQPYTDQSSAAQSPHDGQPHHDGETDCSGRPRRSRRQQAKDEEDPFAFRPQPSFAPYVVTGAGRGRKKRMQNNNDSMNSHDHDHHHAPLPGPSTLPAIPLHVAMHHSTHGGYSSMNKEYIEELLNNNANGNTQNNNNNNTPHNSTNTGESNYYHDVYLPSLMGKNKNGTACNNNNNTTAIQVNHNTTYNVYLNKDNNNTSNNKIDISLIDEDNEEDEDDTSDNVEETKSLLSNNNSKQNNNNNKKGNGKKEDNNNNNPSKHKRMKQTNPTVNTPPLYYQSSGPQMSLFSSLFLLFAFWLLLAPLFFDLSKFLQPHNTHQTTPSDGTIDNYNIDGSLFAGLVNGLISNNNNHNNPDDTILDDYLAMIDSTQTDNTIGHHTTLQHNESTSSYLTQAISKSLELLQNQIQVVEDDFVEAMLSPERVVEVLADGLHDVISPYSDDNESVVIVDKQTNKFDIQGFEDNAIINNNQQQINEAQVNTASNINNNNNNNEALLFTTTTNMNKNNQLTIGGVPSTYRYLFIAYILFYPIILLIILEKFGVLAPIKNCLGLKTLSPQAQIILNEMDKTGFSQQYVDFLNYKQYMKNVVLQQQSQQEDKTNTNTTNNNNNNTTDVNNNNNTNNNTINPTLIDSFDHYYHSKTRNAEGLQLVCDKVNNIARLQNLQHNMEILLNKNTNNNNTTTNNNNNNNTINSTAHVTNNVNTTTIPNSINKQNNTTLPMGMYNNMKMNHSSHHNNNNNNNTSQSITVAQQKESDSDEEDYYYSHNNALLSSHHNMMAMSNNKNNNIISNNNNNNSLHNDNVTGDNKKKNLENTTIPLSSSATLSSFVIAPSLSNTMNNKNTIDNTIGYDLYPPCDAVAAEVVSPEDCDCVHSHIHPEEHEEEEEQEGVKHYEGSAIISAIHTSSMMNNDWNLSDNDDEHNIGLKSAADITP